MAKTTAVDMKRLWELVHEGKSIKEIMQEMNIKDIDAVNNALEEVMQEKGMLKGDSGLVGRASIHPRYTNEGIRISPDMLEGNEFMPGDQFRLTVEKNRIILEKKK